ncbi:class I SAM-dependent methyltransferase [Pelagibacterales bacterium]|nr:class I SAM-dependent methyltransferase [Pelagibacterales bacterium]
MQSKPFTKQRMKIIPMARGRVLEIGIGSGLNFKYYNNISEVFAVEPDGILLEKAKVRAQQNNISLNIQQISAEQLPFEDDFFDTVISTYTMCSIANLSLALNEIKRVLKKEGKLIFSEHGKAPDVNIYNWQKRLNPIQKRIAGGCQLDVNIPVVIKDSGFETLSFDSMYIPGPKFLSYHYWGTATIGQENG